MRKARVKKNCEFPVSVLSQMSFGRLSSSSGQSCIFFFCHGQSMAGGRAGENVSHGGTSCSLWIVTKRGTVLPVAKFTGSLVIG